MSQGFSFPPPPPPPPKPVQNDQNTFNRPYGIGGSNRSRGGSANFSQRGRGYGFRNDSLSQAGLPQRGNYNQRGSRSNHNRGSYSSQSSTPSHQPTQNSANSRNDWSQSSQKRSYTTAFQEHRPVNTKASRPLAPPAIPSFSNDLDNILPKKPPPSTPNVEQSKKQNLLGLTPIPKGNDSESDDEGEEAKLSSATLNTDLLQFEYRGQTATLNSPAEIAAWIAERRKKWPTEEKREIARKEAEERRTRQDAEKAARAEASRIAAKSRQEERQKQKLEQEKSQLRRKMIREQIQNAKLPSTRIDGEENEGSVKSPAELKAERLRRKAEKIAMQLQKAEKRLQRQDHTEQPSVDDKDKKVDQDSDFENLLIKVDRIAEGQADKSDVATREQLDPDDISDIEALTTDEEETSSSGSSSDSDEGSGPEEFSTKRQGPERIQQPSRKAVPDNRPLCNNFTKYGRCKYGHRCHYRHEKPDRKAIAAKEPGIGNRRKGLYHVMVEKEQEEQRKKALQVIIQLGDAGLLGSPASTIQEGKDSLE